VTDTIQPTLLSKSYLSPDEFPALITLEEGYKPTVYDDGKGNVTIGWGFNLSGGVNNDKLVLVLNELGVFSAQTTDTPATIVSNFSAIINAYSTTYHSNIGLLNSALNTELIHYVPGSSFSLTPDQCNNIVDELVLGYSISGYGSSGYQSGLNSVLSSLGVGAQSLIVSGSTPTTITNSSSEVSTPVTTSIPT
jgi:hypothetical protein